MRPIDADKLKENIFKLCGGNFDIFLIDKWLKKRILKEIDNAETLTLENNDSNNK